MIEIEHRVIAGIPLLEVVESSIKNEKLPTVVFYHGWTSVKENVLTHGYNLAKQGLRAILPEALYHGERQDDQPTESHFLDFWGIVADNLKNYPCIMEDYIDKGLTDENRLGVTGLSMGGITTCGIMATNPKVKSAVCLMGTPCFTDFTRYLLSENQLEITPDIEEQLHALTSIDLSLQPEKIANRPFHFWHGTNDEEVPYTLTYDWYQANRDKPYGQHLTFTTTADKHKVPFVISKETAAFFKDTL